MKTPLELALEHAEAYVRERSDGSRGRCEPLTWQEVGLILDELGQAWSNECDCENAA